jgi:hypothetical protein
MEVVVMPATVRSLAGPGALPAFFFTLASLGPVACSGAAPPAGPTTWTSTSGALSVEVRSSPDPPQRGTDTFELTVRDVTSKAPLDNLTLTVTPYMPAHLHGTSLVPLVTAEGQGKYLVTRVDLFMPGHWELQTVLSGAVMDHVVPAFDIP